jgi:hypothetical protein
MKAAVKRDEPYGNGLAKGYGQFVPPLWKIPKGQIKPLQNVTLSKCLLLAAEGLKT